MDTSVRLAGWVPHELKPLADIPPLREVAGGHVLFFDPLDEGAIGAAMRQLAANQVETPDASAHAIRSAQ